ncbi:hypothetical protein [Pseudonocardia ailaonensis]|uniref:hypothetical protein n=1 Tax=Pseudonocardia ailaonensis TaxID=367279 RepID=UPI0031DDB105
MPSQEASRKPDPPSSSPPPATRTLTVSGPTLESLYQQTWGSFVALDQHQCGYLVNNADIADIPVTVLSVTIVGQKPSAPAVFDLYDANTDRSACLPRDYLTTHGRCVAGSVLRQGGNDACYVGIRTTAKQGTDWTAGLVYRFGATCTAPTGRLCAAKAVADLAPTTTSPVVLRWTQTTPLLACFTELDGEDHVDPTGAGCAHGSGAN